MTEYVYDGPHIKLNQKTWDRWSKAYPHLDLKREINQFEILLDSREMDGGNTMKKGIYAELCGRLNGRNARERNEKIRRGENLSIEQQINDRSWHDG